MSEADTTLSKICPFSTNIFLPDRIVCCFIGGRRWGKFGLEVIESVLTSTNVAEEIEVII